MFKTFALALTLACLFGCDQQPLVHSVKPISTLQEQEHALMIGKWYGEATTLDGKRTQQLSERRADGVFTVNFRVTDKSGQWIEQKEFGLWGVSGKIYFTITTGKQVGDEITHAIPGNPHLNDAYEIIELTATTYRSKAQDSGNDFTQKRVGDGFQFPAIQVVKP
ncbi:hypothetical protein [Pseudomonas rhodesiae]|uniref:hypothetical protein n=1 Tax=Pseudomonas rhodesiae TaxID=76760 RepID=UPI00058E678C|nr:hypothetical protein [Pseudomonas rhodesiae]